MLNIILILISTREIICSLFFMATAPSTPAKQTHTKLFQYQAQRYKIDKILDI
jgi:hypothetical protein